MFNGIIFFAYIFAGLASFLAITLVMIIIKHRSNYNKALLSSIRNFMICTLIISALYFFMEYKVLALDVYQASVLFRVFDTAAFIGQVYFWAAFIREKSAIQLPVKNRMKKVALAATLLCLVLTSISYTFFVDSGYAVVSPQYMPLAVGIELILCTYIIVIVLWNLIVGLEEIIEKKSRIYITLISLLIVGNGLWNSILIIPVMTGSYDLAKEKGVPLDPTAILIFLIGLFTLLLVYREDFSTLFQNDNAARSANHYSAKMDMLAETHHLTSREREVFELAYRGLTNPEIAEQLIISKYTVKRHMHNIFEKLDISTRMEMVHLVDNDPRDIRL